MDTESTPRMFIRGNRLVGYSYGGSTVLYATVGERSPVLPVMSSGSGVPPTRTLEGVRAFNRKPRGAPECMANKWLVSLLGSLYSTTTKQRVTPKKVPVPYGRGSKPMKSHFRVGASPILEPILVGIGMFTGGTGFDPWPYSWQKELRGQRS